VISGTARVAPEKAVFRPALPLSVLPAFSGGHMATKLTYKEQLLHPSWQRKRLEILQRDDFHCQRCFDDESTLHVHHKRYVRGRMAWEYPNHELVTVCEVCHQETHAESDAFKELLASLPIDGPGCIGNALSLLAGWANGEQGMDFSVAFNDDPHNYATGEVANRIASKLNMQHLLDLLDALSKAPRWVVQEELTRAAAAMRANVDKDAPPGFMEVADL
jgi:hypothetical protein